MRGNLHCIGRHYYQLIQAGAFGKVFKGEYHSENGTEEVAIKTIKGEPLVCRDKIHLLPFPPE